MKTLQSKKKLFCIGITVIFTLLLFVNASVLFAAETDGDKTVTVLFTHDLHSHLLPATDENGESYGGYARLMTAVKEMKKQYPDALFLDGGDFSQGSLFQTSFRTGAVELRVMGALGVDVTTFGNHEYDAGPAGLSDMLNAALASGDSLPAIVETNYLPEGDSADLQAVRDAFDAYGVRSYLLTERGGVWFAIVSAYGINADEYAPTSEMTLLDTYTTVADTIAAAKEECMQTNGVTPFVICLSHSGTENGQGEDYELAQNVDGIDLIISGHTHTTLCEPIVVGNTQIVSAGAYAKYLGVISFTVAEDGTKTVSDYTLVPIDDSIAEDETLAAVIEGYKTEVEDTYLSQFGVGFDDVLTYNPYAFESVESVGATLHESPLCNVFSDAYRLMAEKVTGEPVDIALTAYGVIRETLPTGNITVSDVFTAASLGTGKGTLPGGTLLSLYLTGSDVKNLLEIDATVQMLMPAAQLFCSGVTYTVNTNRMLFNRVSDAALVKEDGTTVPIENDTLYHIVTGSYAGSMLGTVGKKSYGLLSLTPRDKDGNPLDIDALINEVIVDENGTELKEWYAIAAYLLEMGGEMDARYSTVDGRKQVISSLSPVALLKNANKFTYIALFVILLVLVLLALLVRGIFRRIRVERLIHGKKTEKSVSDDETQKS